jgi:hypothetical protein
MTISALDTLLTILHDRGVINETAFEQVCGELWEDEGDGITVEQLARIFGPTVIWKRITVPDDQARQLVRDAFDLLTNPESPVDHLQWLTTAKRLLGEPT